MAERDIEVRGLDSTILRIQGVDEKARSQIRRMLIEAAEIVHSTMLAGVPRDKGELAGTIRIGGLSFAPGGPGGGGYWEIEVGPENPPEHLDFVFGGTGVFGPTGTAIRPATGNVMNFINASHGGEMFRGEVQGQEPQTEWVEDAQEAGRNMIEFRIHGLDFG